MTITELYSTRRAAEYLGMHVNTLRKAIATGKIEPDSKMGKQEQLLFSKDTLDEYALKYRNTKDPNLLTLAEVGGKYHINPDMAWRAIAKRDIEPDAYIGRIRLYDVKTMEWLAGVEGWVQTVAAPIP